MSLVTATIWAHAILAALALTNAVAYLVFCSTAEFAVAAEAPDAVFDQLSAFEEMALPVLDLALVPAYLAPSILLIFMLAIAYRRLHTDVKLGKISDFTPRYGQGWAIGAWFIPIASWWILPRIWRDLLVAGGEPKASFYSGFFTLSLVLDSITTATTGPSIRMSQAAETFEEIIAYYRFDAYTSLVDAFTAVLMTVLLVRMRTALRSRGA